MHQPLNPNGQHRDNGSATQPRVVVAVPSTGHIHHACMDSIREMIRTTRGAAEIAFWWDNDRPHDRCRNALIERFVADDRWSHLLFIDTDEVVHPDTLDRLLSHDADIAAAPVPCTFQRYGLPGDNNGVTIGTNVMMFDEVARRGSIIDPDAPDRGYRRLDPDDFPDHPFTCDAVGMGLCLIRRRVFECVDRPWCAFVGDGDTGVGEDIYFMRKARAAGFDILIDPQVMPDHYKPIDLTHLDLLFSDKIPVSPWPRLQTPDDSRRVIVAARVPQTGWMPIRSADVLQEWELNGAGRVHLESLRADTFRSAVHELTGRLTGIDGSFSRILFIGDDVVPHSKSLGLMASVDAPIVAALTRTLIDGHICWSHWHRDGADGTWRAPQNINLPQTIEPFDADAVDLSCAMIDRSLLEHVLPRVPLDDLGPHPDHAFMQRFCQTATEITGLRPRVIPLTVERRAEIGLRGLLNLKMRLKSQFRAQQERPAPQPA